MAFDGFSGDESGLLAVGAGISQIDGTGFSISSTQKKSGVYAYRLQPNSAASRLHQSIAARSVGSMHVAVYFATAPGSPCNFYMGFRPSVNSGNVYAVLFNEFNSFYAQAGGGSATANFTYATGQWYVIDMYVNVSGTTHTVVWYVNGSRQPDATLTGQSATTLSACVLGHDNLTPSGDIYFDDWIWGNASGDIPFDIGGFSAYAVNGEGTHALDASPSQFFFKHDGTTLAAITSSDTSYQNIDEVPLASDAARVLIKSASGGGGTDTNIAPTSIQAQSGWSTTIAAIDEDPDTPGTDWATAPNNNTTCSVRVGFPTPSNNPTGNITVDVYVRKNAASGSGTPTCEIDLYENGTLVASGSAQSVTSTTGQKLSQTFSSYTLSDPTGAGLEVLVTGSASGGNPNSRSSVDLNAVNIASLAYSSVLVPTTSEYLEYAFSDESTQNALNGVLAIIAADQDSASTALYVAKLFDSVQGTNTEDIYNDSAFNVGTTKTYKSKLFTQRPNSGGTWTQSALNGLRLRFGYTNNPAGNIRLEGAVLIGYFGTQVTTYSKTGGSKSSLVVGGTKSAFTFPSTPILDDFTRTDQGPPPGPLWSYPTFPAASNTGLVVRSNQAANISATLAATSYLGATTDGRPFEAYVTAPVRGTGNLGIDYFIRNPNTSSVSGYRLQTISGDIRVYRVDNTVFTQIFTTTRAMSDGDSLGISVDVNGIHTIWYKSSGGSWTSLGTVTDTTYTSGYNGLVLDSGNTTSRLDNFGGSASGAVTTYSKTGGGKSPVIADATKIPKFVKVAGGVSAGLSGAHKQYVFVKTGGGILVGVEGAVKLLSLVKTGGGVSPLITGTSKRITTSRTAGAISVSVSGASKAVQLAKASGGISILVVGTSKFVTATKVGGGKALSIAGAARITSAVKVAGAVSGLVSGGSRALQQIHAGGAISALIASATKIAVTSVPKIGGGVTAGLSGAIKIVNIGYLKTGGAVVVSIAGGSERRLLQKTSGSTSILTAGAVRYSTFAKQAGAVSNSVSGASYTKRIISVGGAITGGVAGASQIGNRSKIGGAIATGLSGTSKLAIQVHAGGAITSSVSGATYSRGIAKTGGGITIGFSSATRVTLRVFVGGGIALGIVGVSKSWNATKTAGGISPSLGGGSWTNQDIQKIQKTGGGIVVSLSGTPKNITAVKTSGAVSTIVSGAFKNITFAKISGAVVILVEGASRNYLTLKYGGVNSVLVVGVLKALTAQKTSGAVVSGIAGATEVIFISESGGSETGLRVGGTQITNIGYLKIGGAISTALVGTDKALAIVKDGGSITKVVAGSSEKVISYGQFGGAIVVGVGGLAKAFAAEKTGGGITNAIATGAWAYVHSVIGGADSVAFSGGVLAEGRSTTGGAVSTALGGAQRLTAGVRTGGGVAVAHAGGVEGSTRQEMLASDIIDILATAIRKPQLVSATEGWEGI